MICPYNQNSHYQEVEYVYDECEERTSKTIVKEVWGNSPCLKDKCAVWIDGRCRYNEW